MGLNEASLIRSVVAKYNRDNVYVESVFEVMQIVACQVAEEYRADYEQLWFRSWRVDGDTHAKSSR